MIRIGIDIGGTGIKVGAVDEQMNIIATGSIPTQIDIPFEDQIKRIAECVISLIQSNGTRKISMEDIVKQNIRNQTENL